MIEMREHTSSIREKREDTFLACLLEMDGLKHKEDTRLLFLLYTSILFWTFQLFRGALFLRALTLRWVFRAEQKMRKRKPNNEDSSDGSRQFTTTRRKKRRIRQENPPHNLSGFASPLFLCNYWFSFLFGFFSFSHHVHVHMANGEIF